MPLERAPRPIRGGLVLLNPFTGETIRVVPLQYNPDSLSRTLQVRSIAEDPGDRGESLRLKGPAIETIKMEAEIDASDDLERGTEPTLSLGLHPKLAALESLVQPHSGQLILSGLLAGSGTLEIAPVQAPVTVFVFGPQRIVPVRVTELSITEEAFDNRLNPIRAKVNLSLRVLSVDDFKSFSLGGSLFMSYLQAREQLPDKAPGFGLGALGIDQIL